MPPLLDLQRISKDFGGLQVLGGIDLALEAGHTRVIIGPNGCGKTTLFNIITGAFRPTGGRVVFRGEDITGLAPHRIARKGIARKFQVPGIYPSLTVAENLEAARLGVGTRHPGADASDLQRVMVRFGLSEVLDRPAGTLSHGRKQWLEIAMLLNMDAALLLLDEPTAGMSAAETAATADLLRDLARERGVAVLIIEHDMSFVRAMDCPVVVALRGRVVFEGSYEEAQAHPDVRDAYLGNA
ncbi:MAG: ATP-binding cassette domain-containing protein [Burkholderiales bacterium]